MKKWKLCAGIICLAALQLAALTISPRPYGINVHLAQNETLDKVKAAGIAWIRIDINWYLVEPNRGRINFADVDRVVNFATANGLSVLASIGYTPAWANGKKEKWIAYPAANVNDWKGFVRRVIDRYRNTIKYWSIWNEPNLKKYFEPGKDVFLQQVFLPAAQTIRAADPAAFIVGPDLSHKTEAGTEWYFWLKYILDNAGAYLDIISHHIYESLGVYYLFELLEEGDKLIPAVKEIIQESGQGNKPFWITETGWNTSRFSEPMQANRYLDMLHTRARKDYPQKIFFYEIIDDPRASDGPFGILRNNGEAKPAYSAYRDYIAGLYPDPGNPDENKTNKKCYSEQMLNGRVAAARDQSLQQLQRTRQYLDGYSASAQKIVKIYYDWNEEFHQIALADSRVFNLGREILEQALLVLACNGRADLSQHLPAALFSRTANLVGILQKEYSATALGPLAALIGRNLELIRQMPMNELLEYYLKEEILDLEKIR